MSLAAHRSRAFTLTEWLDPSIVDERDPSKKIIEFDLYNPLMSISHHIQKNTLKDLEKLKLKEIEE